MKKEIVHKVLSTLGIFLIIALAAYFFIGRSTGTINRLCEENRVMAQKVSTYMLFAAYELKNDYSKMYKDYFEFKKEHLRMVAQLEKIEPGADIADKELRSWYRKYGAQYKALSGLCRSTYAILNIARWNSRFTRAPFYSLISVLAANKGISRQKLEQWLVNLRAENSALKEMCAITEKDKITKEERNKVILQYDKYLDLSYKPE